jgi:hypothetical protein
MADDRKNKVKGGQPEMPLPSDGRTRADIRKWMDEQGIDYEEEKYLLMDGHDNAFIGMVESFGQPLRACYDRDMVIANLVCQFRPAALADLKRANKDNVPERTLEALEAEAGCVAEDLARAWYDFNIKDAWTGPTTPVRLRKL